MRKAFLIIIHGSDSGVYVDLSKLVNRYQKLEERYIKRHVRHVASFGVRDRTMSQQRNCQHISLL